MTKEEFMGAIGRILDENPSDKILDILEEIKNGFPDVSDLEQQIADQKERFKRRFMGQTEEARVKEDIREDEKEDKELIVEEKDIFEK